MRAIMNMSVMEVMETFSGYFAASMDANETEDEMITELMTDPVGTGEKYTKDEAEYIAYVYERFYK